LRTQTGKGIDTLLVIFTVRTTASSGGKKWRRLRYASEKLGATEKAISIDGTRAVTDPTFELRVLNSRKAERRA
jgi:hypothetical protein